MSQATMYLGDQEIARDVIRLEPTEDGVRFAAFFEDPKVVREPIQRIDFRKHRVMVEPLEENHGRD